MAAQSCVAPQQVTDPSEFVHMPVATVQVSVEPPEHGSVQVCEADATVGPP
jgi:hypothetical protein